MPVQPTSLAALEWRLIGPHRGGRCVAVTGDPKDPSTFYFGACSGGIWKTNDAGAYWENVSDGFVNTAAVGAIEVAPSDPNVIYAGMGEACIRGNVSHGDGVYRSTDAGRTWQHMGLEDTRHIGRVRVHPSSPDIVYVAALGHAFGPNPTRGVFRSKDGGKNWEHVLFKNEDTGAVDLSIDPRNPRIIYAALWDVRRFPWALRSGGPGSGLWKSTDGGDTWTDITESPGLPKGLKGRIGVAVSPAQSGRVWAIVEAEEGGFFRSDDGGATWERVSEDRDLRQRPWYYMHVFADPQDPDTCYILNLRMWKSTDGGKTFAQVTTPHGDNHDLWIDPQNPRRMIEGNDGGACVSYNGGASWSTIYNQPTSQFYHVTTDTQFPYRVYGTQQDNSAISVPSRSHKGAIPYGDCYPVGSSESGHIQVRPDNPNIVYSGAIGSAPGGGGPMWRYDHATGQSQLITVWPEAYGGFGPKDMKHRFQWTYPILISPHDPNTLYVTGERVFKSTNEGMSWEAISPDLTRNDPDKLGPSGGPITRDTTGAEHYCTIFAFSESPHEQGVFWAGSDDGLLHLSRDGGRTWNDVTPRGLPEWSTINVIEVSAHDKATAYLAAWRYKLDDTQPLLFKTTDYGASWARITDGIPAHDFTRVIRADPARPGLLYAGTETGLYVSFDDGASWQRFDSNLPVVPVYDLQVKGNELVAGTHGRSFWILDDLTPLRELSEDILNSEAHLFSPPPKIRARPLPGAAREAGPGKNYMMGLGASVTYTETKRPDGSIAITTLDGGKNPPDGVVVTYYLKEEPAGEVALSFLDAKGEVIKTFTSKKPEKEAKPDAADTAPDEAAIEATEEGEEGIQAEEPAEKKDEPVVAKSAGLNRFIWNMRYPDATKITDDKATEGAVAGPVAPPGTYSVRLTVAGQTHDRPFQIVKDPRIKANQEDFDAQFELAIQVRDKLSSVHDAINKIRTMRTQVDGYATRGKGQVRDAAKKLQKQLTVIEETLIEPRIKGQLDSIHYPTKLNAKLAALPPVVMAADSAPPQQAYEVFKELTAKADAALQPLTQLLETDIPAFNTLVRQENVPAIIPEP
ncbi:MAG: glycosyl hydrolase [Chloroflexi bacterium]|nr:glycosyl hydrolase [Chloroflexota bacterium]